MFLESKTLVPLLGCAALGAIGVGAALNAADSRAAFHGVWRTIEVTVPGPASQIFKPATTLAIFHGAHYARVEVHSEQARPVVKDASRASADELRAVWGPFVGVAGTFEVSGDTITMQASVAKNPAAMTNGATSVYTYQQSGDRLTLTQMRTPGGPSANPVTIKLARIE